MAKLTQAEKRLLRYPPTTKTWRCKGYLVVDGEKKLCGQLTLGMATKCFLCGKAKPRTPELVWPEYERACQKAGIEPGTRWRETTPTPQAADAPKKRIRRKGSK